MDETAVEEPVVDARSRWRRRTPLLVIFVITAIGIAAVIYGVANQRTLEPIDSATQKSIGRACTNALTQLKSLPPITSQSTIAERAGRVDAENIILQTIVDAAASGHASNRDGATALRGWTDDWRSLLRARAKFADELRGPVAKPQLVLPEVGGAPVTDRMNQWSRTHTLAQCATDNLQAEIVDGGRTYPAKVENG